MKKVKIVFIAVLLSSMAQSQVSKQHNQVLKQIVEDFRTTIINHNDEEKFDNLFLNDSITWGAIVTGKTKTHVLKQRPDFTFQSSDPKSFYKNLNDGDEEKFYNVNIDVRGDFATISFDYSFNSKSVIQNWGVEYWSLILVNDSWKLTSVTWSMNMEQLEKCPFVAADLFVLNQ
ncbi:MAG: hypothetical protein V7719_15155 [Psychroserpens sp.]|uniref:hypothetical protein n=1 Tax=Psychroserpens sp. TaxID=2020870 RepID=UPI0030035445